MIRLPRAALCARHACLQSHVSARALLELSRPRPLARLALPRLLSASSSRPTPQTPSPSPPSPSPPPPQSPQSNADKKERRENIYTIPNALTVARIAACPFIGHLVLAGNLEAAAALLFVAGVTDLVDGWLARKYGMGTVLGSILDPAADKLLMTTMVVCLAMRDLLPLPLAALILGRDIALSLTAFYLRFASLPPPKTFTRYWDFSIPSAEVRPTQISKYNTFMQLALVGVSTVAPILPIDLGLSLAALQWTVAGTTIASGMSYIFSTSAVKFIK